MKHAKRELEIAGYVDEDGPNAWMRDNVLELLAVFNAQGHSGSSAPCCVNLFRKLALHEPLKPLTGEDSEWQDVEEVKQNTRCSHVFKENGIAYDIDGYVFWEWAERPLEEGEEGYPGTHRFKSAYSCGHSHRLVTFPYTPKTEYVEIVDEEYPEHIVAEGRELQRLIGESNG